MSYQNSDAPEEFYQDTPRLNPALSWLYEMGNVDELVDEAAAYETREQRNRRLSGIAPVPDAVMNYEQNFISARERNW